jgi:hypothetical protein
LGRCFDLSREEFRDAPRAAFGVGVKSADEGKSGEGAIAISFVECVPDRWTLWRIIYVFDAQ